MDISIHSYPGSTTKEKISIVDNYSERKLKTIIVQDGTNSLLKSRNASVDDLMQDYLDMIKKVDEKFNPNKIVLIIVPPLRNNPGNKYHNSRIIESNTKIREHLETKYQIINIHEIMESMKDYNVLLHDERHFNYRNGILFLRNQVLLHCLGSSNGIIAGRPISNYSRRDTRRQDYYDWGGFRNKTFATSSWSQFLVYEWCMMMRKFDESYDPAIFILLVFF